MILSGANAKIVLFSLLLYLVVVTSKKPLSNRCGYLLPNSFEMFLVLEYDTLCFFSCFAILSISFSSPYSLKSLGLIILIHTTLPIFYDGSSALSMKNLNTLLTKSAIVMRTKPKNTIAKYPISSVATSVTGLVL